MPKKELKTFVVEDQKIVKENGKVYLTGYANTKGHADSHGDIPVSLDGEPIYDLERMATNPVCFVDHNSSASNIAGNFIDLKEDDRGLFIKLLFRDIDKIHNPMVKDAVQSWVDGFGRALSIGGYWIHGDKDNSAHLTKAIVFEISLVGIGSDAEALIDSEYPKSHGEKAAIPFQEFPIADRGSVWDQVSALGRVQELVGAENGGIEDPEVQAKYRTAFLYYDREDMDQFWAYKMPVADVVDGNLTIIPRAVFSAALSMRGGRGGGYINQEDRPAVTRTIEKYYEKMGLESPFVGEKSFRVDDLPSLDERTFEKMLKSGNIKFSSTVAKTIISRLKADFSRDGEEESGRDDGKDLGCVSDLLRKTLKTITKET